MGDARRRVHPVRSWGASRRDGPRHPVALSGSGRVAPVHRPRLRGFRLPAFLPPGATRRCDRDDTRHLPRTTVRDGRLCTGVASDRGPDHPRRVRRRRRRVHRRQPRHDAPDRRPTPRHGDTTHRSRPRRRLTVVRSVSVALRRCLPGPFRPERRVSLDESPASLDDTSPAEPVPQRPVPP